MIKRNQKVRVKRLKGLGGVLQKQLAPLETNEIFLKKYSNLKMTLLLNATDSNYAALVSFNNGKIDIEAISNKDKKKLKKKELYWDGMLATTVPIFLKIAMGELGLGAMVKKILTRKMKVKGVKKLLVMKKIFSLL